jgi:hypothetical protein
MIFTAWQIAPSRNTKPHEAFPPSLCDLRG